MRECHLSAYYRKKKLGYDEKECNAVLKAGGMNRGLGKIQVLIKIYGPPKVSRSCVNNRIRKGRDPMDALYTKHIKKSGPSLVLGK